MAVAGEAVAGEAVAGEAVAGEAVAGEAVAGEAVAGEAVTGELTATTSDSDVGGTEDSSSSVSTVSLLDRLKAPRL